MSALFGNTVEIPGRMSPGEFSLKSGALGAQYGALFNQAFQSAANRQRQAQQGAPPMPRSDGYDPRASQSSLSLPNNFNWGRSPEEQDEFEMIQRSYE